MKKYHNKLKYLVLALAFCVLYISGCNDDPVAVTPPTPFSTGTANFAMYVSIGNSLTAGFQSNALSARDQAYSFPSMIARQAQAAGTFEQPLIKNPGLPGRLRLLNLAPTIVTETPVAADISSNLNAALARPYNNLGIPGAKLREMIKPFTPTGFFGLILRDPSLLGSTVVKQARNLQATFVTAWIGNNDVLGYALTGGGWSLPVPFLPTSTSDFSIDYKEMLDSLTAETTRGVIVGNIPDVSSIPFFTTIGPKVAAGTPWAAIAAGQVALAPFGAPGIIYMGRGASSKNIPLPGLNFKYGFADSSALRNGTTLFTLAGQTYASLIGQPTGLFYRDLAASTGFPLATVLSFFPGVDTMQAFGVSPFNPYPDVYVLDPDEIATSKTAADAFNAIIATEAGSRNIAVVDFNAFLKNLLTNPIVYPGIGVFTSGFISGGTFSYDGVHPSSRGYGIIANEWIRVINQKFNATIPPVDLNSLPGMPIGKAPAKEITYAPGVFNSMVRLMTGNKNWPANN